MRNKPQMPRPRATQDANASRTTTPGPRGAMSQPAINHEAEHGNNSMIRSYSDHADQLHPVPTKP